MIFEVKNGNYAYSDGVSVLNNVSFKIEDNEVLSVLGPNGVGKTTLIKCMLGLLPWQGGSSSFNGVSCQNSNSKILWKQIGYVPQRKQMGFSYTVKEMVTLGRTAHLGMFALPGSHDKEIVRNVMDMVGVTHIKNKLCSQISGGELQMVLIARALALQPQLLILDEPESNLDFRNQRIVLDLIKSLKSEFNISSILNTHFPDHAMELSDSVLLLPKNAAPTFGKVNEVMIEENLKRTFDVNVYIREIDIDNGKYTCIVPGEIVRGE